MKPKVLRVRFGIDMNTDRTLEEVGKQFDVTRERIRQIEAKALRKITSSKSFRNLKEVSWMNNYSRCKEKADQYLPIYIMHKDYYML